MFRFFGIVLIFLDINLQKNFFFIDVGTCIEVNRVISSWGLSEITNKIVI